MRGCHGRGLPSVCLGLTLAVGPWMTAVVYPQAAPTMPSPAARLVPITTPGTAASPPLVPISYAPPGPPLPAAVTPAGSLPPLVRIDSVPTPPVVPNRIAAVRITPLPVAPPVAAIAPLPTRPVTPPIVTPLPSAAPVAIASPPPVVLPQRLPPQSLPQQVAVPSPQLPTPLQERMPQQATLSPQATLPPQGPPQQASLPQPPAASPATTPAAAPPAAAPATGKPTDAITIASFNIQVFGESKIAKPQVVDVLARVVRGCDIVAIQEVRAKSDHVIPQFLEAVNADGSRYQFVIGPRLGRTASKEQYVFMYDTTRIEIDSSSVATVPNPGDRLHRPPMVARFRVRTTPPESGFSFWLVDIHTDPDEVPQEVDALADVFVAMRSARPDEDDVILLGDLNAGPPQFGRLGQIPGIGWAVSGVTTNTRRSKTYDNIIFDRAATSEYTGRWGVLDLQTTFGLSLDQALTVSDHNPVWACFRPWETQRTGSLPSAPGQSQ